MNCGGHHLSPPLLLGVGTPVSPSLQTRPQRWRRGQKGPLWASSLIRPRRAGPNLLSQSSVPLVFPRPLLPPAAHLASALTDTLMQKNKKVSELRASLSTRQDRPPGWAALDPRFNSTLFCFAFSRRTEAQRPSSAKAVLLRGWAHRLWNQLLV